MLTSNKKLGESEMPLHWTGSGSGIKNECSRPTGNPGFLSYVDDLCVGIRYLDVYRRGLPTLLLLRS